MVIPPIPHYVRDDAELVRTAVMAEQEFAWGLIRTYREFQMQAVGLSIALYAAVLGLIGSAIDSPRFNGVASYATALLPYPTAVLVLAFAVMEVRIRRASRHSVRTIAPKLELLRTDLTGPPLLEWESNPSRHLTAFERSMANSSVFVVGMTLPALGGTVWHLFAGALSVQEWHPFFASIGTALLVASAVIGITLSIGHESRRRIQRQTRSPGPPTPARASTPEPS